MRDRDRLRGEHLQRLGWRYHRLWSTNWFRNPADEVAKVQEAYYRAVGAAEADRPAASSVPVSPRTPQLRLSASARPPIRPPPGIPG